MGIREQLARASAKPERFEGIDGFEEPVFIRRMTLGEADELQATAAADAKQSNTIRLLARFLGDENGERVFDLAKGEDVKALKAIPVTVAARLLELGNQVNAPKAKDVEKKD